MVLLQDQGMGNKLSGSTSVNTNLIYASQFGAVDKVKFYKNNAPESLKNCLFVL